MRRKEWVKKHRLLNVNFWNDGGLMFFLYYKTMQSQEKLMLSYGNVHPFPIASPAPVFRCKISIDKTETTSLYFPQPKTMPYKTNFIWSKQVRRSVGSFLKGIIGFITPTNRRRGTYGSDAESGSYLESA